MTITAVVVSHAREAGLRGILGNLHYQTRRPDETLVFASGYEPGVFARLAEHFPWAVFHREDDQRDWGHHKRAAGLERATGDYVGWFNDDDTYDDDYIQEMMGAVSVGADVAYCAWNTYPSCTFNLGSSTSGNFIVRTELAQRVGYPATRVYENDGHFIEALNRAGATVVRVDRLLYFHNVPTRG